MTEDFLRDELRRAMDEHTPDRTVMLNRVATNRAATGRPRGRAIRLAGSALAVTTVLGLGGVAKWALADDGDPGPAAVAPASPSPSHSPSVVATATDPASRPVTSRPRTQAPPSPTSPTSPTSAPQSAPAVSASPVRGHPGDTQVQKGSLSSNSSASTGESTVTLTAGADLTELDLTVRVTLTPGLTSTGIEPPSGAVTATVTKDAGALLYHFVLKSGSTLTAGTYTFTAKYDGGTRNTADDTYEAYAFSVERKRIHIYGNFTATE